VEQDLPNVILRRAEALRGTFRSACGSKNVVGNAHAAKAAWVPVHGIKAFGPRKVPRAGFAAVQDDKN
jgi:hypothetical protein